MQPTSYNSRMQQHKKGKRLSLLRLRASKTRLLQFKHHKTFGEKEKQLGPYSYTYRVQQEMNLEHKIHSVCQINSSSFPSLVDTAHVVSILVTLQLVLFVDMYMYVCILQSQLDGVTTHLDDFTVSIGLLYCRSWITLLFQMDHFTVFVLFQLDYFTVFYCFNWTTLLFQLDYFSVSIGLLYRFHWTTLLTN